MAICVTFAGPAAHSEPEGDVAFELITPALMAIGHTSGGDRGRPVMDPAHTTVSKAEECVIAPSLIQYHSEQTDRVRGQALDDQLMTVDAAGRYGLNAATLVKYYGNDQHGQNIMEPTHTVTAKDREGLVTAHLSKFHGASIGNGIDEPVNTVLSRNHEGLALPFLSKYYAGGHHGKGNSPVEPLNTVTTAGHNAIAAAHVVKFKGDNLGQDAREPLQTITTCGSGQAGGGQFGEVITTLAKVLPGTPLYHWPEIRALLNEHCGYSLSEDEILLLWICGIPYFLADIGLRMLTPHELYLANGFPPDYIIDVDYTGKAYPKTKQVARCGNAVPPQFAEALVRANLPELCCTVISTMYELEKMMAI